MQTSNSTQQHKGAARRDCLDTSTEPVPGREGEPACLSSPCTALPPSEELLWRQSPLSETDPECPSPGTCPEWPWPSSQSPSGSGQTPAPKQKPGLSQSRHSSHSTSSKPQRLQQHKQSRGPEEEPRQECTGSEASSWL